MPLLGPGVICRLDARLLERIRRGESLGAVVASAIATIVIGAGAYGIAFGVWRAPEQALYAAIKLPLLLLTTAACSIGLSAILAPVLRSKLSFRQTAICILVSLAVTAALLGAMAPVAILFASSAPAPDPAALGLPIEHPAVQPSLAVARALLLLHVAALGCAGTIGVVRLLGLISKLGDPPVVARRVLVGWLALQFATGAELSWLMRPFFGRPHLRPTFDCEEVLDGNFYEEVWILMRSAFGLAAPLVLAVAATALATWLFLALRTRKSSVVVEVGGGGLAVFGPGARVVGWRTISSVRTQGAVVIVELHADESLVHEEIVAEGSSPEGARDLVRRIEVERSRVPAGPFRTASG